MDEKPRKNFPIVGMIALICVMFLAVKLIFAGLEAAIPQQKRIPDPAPAQSAPADLPAPSFCPNCGEKLPESFQWGRFCPYCGEKVE